MAEKSAELANFAKGFLQLLTFTTGAFSGKPFTLQQWQESALTDFYGTEIGRASCRERV